MICGVVEDRAMDLDIIPVCPLLRIQTLEFPGSGIEPGQRGPVNRIQPAINTAIGRIERYGIEADPAVKPIGICGEVSISPAPGDLLLPPVQFPVAQNMRGYFSCCAHNLLPGCTFSGVMSTNN